MSSNIFFHCFDGDFADDFVADEAFYFEVVFLYAD